MVYEIYEINIAMFQKKVCNWTAVRNVHSKINKVVPSRVTLNISPSGLSVNVRELHDWLPAQPQKSTRSFIFLP